MKRGQSESVSGYCDRNLGEFGGSVIEVCKAGGRGGS